MTGQAEEVGGVGARTENGTYLAHRRLAATVKRKASFLAGIRAVAPALAGNVPFGVIVGVTATSVGIDPIATVAMSALVFAGAAQLAMIDLLREHAPLVIVVLTGLVVNLRYVMYSAAVGPYFEDHDRRWKAIVAGLLLDITFAMSVTTFEERDEVEREWYYLGVGLPLWITWVVATAAGAVLGAGVPASWQLDFAIPLVFLALLMPTIDGFPGVVAAVLAGATAVGLGGLPFNLGLLVGALTGVLGGAVVEAGVAS